MAGVSAAAAPRSWLGLLNAARSCRLLTTTPTAMLHCLRAMGQARGSRHPACDQRCRSGAPCPGLEQCPAPAAPALRTSEPPFPRSRGSRALGQELPKAHPGTARAAPEGANCPSPIWEQQQSWGALGQWEGVPCSFGFPLTQSLSGAKRKLKSEIKMNVCKRRCKPCQDIRMFLRRASLTPLQQWSSVGCFRDRRGTTESHMPGCKQPCEGSRSQGLSCAECCWLFPGAGLQPPPLPLSLCSLSLHQLQHSDPNCPLLTAKGCPARGGFTQAGTVQHSRLG